ncbi:MAG: phosphate/phosphite/phosphonate ABC transporter substrate-binding protein [Tepidisphaeraceae bacterium]|jgi:phosphonate transport system substrate-binding protein
MTDSNQPTNQADPQPSPIIPPPPAPEPQPSAASVEPAPPPSQRTSPILLFFIAVVIAALGGGTWYYIVVQKPLQERIDAQQDAIIRLSGLQNPVNNKLDPAYTDSTGDLVADPPTDPSQFVDPPKLRFCYVYAEDDSPYKTAFADFMKHLSDETGKPVEYADFNSTDDHLSALKHNQLEVTAFNTGNVPIAVCAAGFVPVACLGSEQGAGKYEMQILVRSDSPIQSVADLPGHELTLTNPGSNSGYKAPLVLIKSDFGLLPGRDFGVRYSGGHVQSIKGLADGTYEVAAVASDVVKLEIANGDIQPNQFRVIYKSEAFPTAGIGYAYNLKPDLTAKIKQAILDFNWSGTSMATYFAPSGEDRFVPVNYKDDWALVRRIDDEIGYAYQVK